MGEIIRQAKLYALRKEVIKRLEVLSDLLKIKQEPELETEYEIFYNRLRSIDQQIFEFENRNK